MTGARCFIGLMSGTSVDAVDGVLLRFDVHGRPDATLAFASLPFDPDLRAAIHRLQQASDDELALAARTGVALARRYADVVARLLTEAGLPASAVSAVGAHGQTVRHRPEHGYTVQLLNAAWLAELAGIAVVADLRSADVAAGGQGAPLVPAFHAQVFGAGAARRVILNLGGIANVTLLQEDGTVAGHDTGPGNTLLDAWCLRHRGTPYDADGRWAATGRVDDRLLQTMLAEPYFAQPAPKSTGRDLFNGDWLDRHLAGTAVRPEDVQATLVALSAATIAQAVSQARAREVYVCGGGVANATLMAALRDRVTRHRPGVPVASTAALGVHPQAVEASAFAWLAMRRLDALPGNLPTVTGARGPRVLGAVYPAGPAPRA